MKKLDFISLYYNIDSTFISNIIPDINPVVRVCGIDETSGYGTVFTAIGSRFDADYAQKEAFKWTESYESDAKAVDRVNISEAMRYVRTVAVAENKLLPKYEFLVDQVKADKNLYGNVRMKTFGDDNAEIVFLPGPASQIKTENAEKFEKLAKLTNKSFKVVCDYNDCGYMKMELGLDLDELQVKLEEDLKDANYIVTDDAYVLDALLVLLPNRAKKIYFLDQFVADHLPELFANLKGEYVLHESGMVNRVYPTRMVDYETLANKAKFNKPQRSGYDVTDSGIAGGLGVFEEDVQNAVGQKRYDELANVSGGQIITPCSAEAYGLNEAINDNKVMTLLDLITK